MYASRELKCKTCKLSLGNVLYCTIKWLHLGQLIWQKIIKSNWPVFNIMHIIKHHFCRWKRFSKLFCVNQMLPWKHTDKVYQKESTFHEFIVIAKPDVFPIFVMKCWNSCPCVLCPILNIFQAQDVDACKKWGLRKNQHETDNKSATHETVKLTSVPSITIIWGSLTSIRLPFDALYSINKIPVFVRWTFTEGHS